MATVYTVLTFHFVQLWPSALGQVGKLHFFLFHVLSVFTLNLRAGEMKKILINFYSKRVSKLLFPIINNRILSQLKRKWN